MAKEQKTTEPDIRDAANEEVQPAPTSREDLYRPSSLFEVLKTALQWEYNPRSRRRQHERIGEMLVSMGAVKQWQLDDAIDEQRRSGQLLGKILLDRDYVDAQTVSIALSKVTGLEYAPLNKTISEPEALDAVSESIAVKYRLLPVSLENDRLTVLLEAPQDRNSLDDVAVLLGMRLHPMLTTTDNIRREIKARYHSAKVKKKRPQSVIMTADERAKIAATMESLQSGIKPAPKKAPEEAAPKKTGTKAKGEAKAKPATGAGTISRFKQTHLAATGMPVVQLVSTIIEDAINAGATDIHLDPQEPEMRIRYRVDGVLHDVLSIPENLEPAVVSRVKIMADMDITETRLPQDGHISVVMGDKECDIRIATMPTFLGERVVLRLLDQSAILSGLEGLGLEAKDEERLRKIIKEPYGMILVTGPTGSGKTTTLYAALNQKDVTTESIVTLEDPVEYQMSGINQVQIDTDIDLTFARTLRASLRQDIDVLLVGEIRDIETARIAVRAAMTGHLVFSTLHTNDAPEAITTLRNMGVPSYLLGSALTAVIGQRLVRKMCTSCKTQFKPSKALLKSIGLPETTRSLYRGKGCEKCYHTGSRGRTGIFEILTMTPTIRRMITDEEPTEKIIKEAKLQTLAESCRIKVKKGIIAPEEFLRVIRY